jgi:hypothetical protein
MIERFFSVAGKFQQRAVLKYFLAASDDNNGCRPFAHCPFSV